MGGGVNDKMGLALMAIMNGILGAYGQAAYDRTVEYAESVGTHNVDMIADWAATTFGYGDSTKKGKKRNRENPDLVKVRNVNGLLQTSNVPNGYIQEAQSLTSSVVKLGKPLYERNYLEAFMRMMNGKGRLYVQYGHMMDFDLNKRSIHVECFRHNVGYNTGDRTDWFPAYSQNSPIPTDIALHAYYTNEGMSSGHIITQERAVTLPFKPVTHGVSSFSSITRPILEDESFNLNKLKFDFRFGHQFVDDTTPSAGYPVKFLDMVDTRTNEYKNKSYLWQHNHELNLRHHENGDVVAEPGVKGPPVQYDAVLNQGKITYKLMNKGAYPINVEFIIYKIKQNTEPLLVRSDVDVNGDVVPFSSDSQVYDSIVQPIENAYMDKKSQYTATNLFGGRKPSKTDVTSDPRFKCLPNIARGAGYNNPWKEETRFTCCIPSGARKIQQIILPGAIYNPLNVSSGKLFESEFTNALADQMTYAVAIAASGTLTTQDMHGYGYNIKDGFSADTSSYGTAAVGAENFIGDCYSEGQLQWLVEYEEQVSACIARMPQRRDLLSYGEVNQPDGSRADGASWFRPRAAPIIPATNVMRTTAHGITMSHADSSGNPVYANMGSSGMGAAPTLQNDFARSDAPDAQGQDD